MNKIVAVSVAASIPTVAPVLAEEEISSDKARAAVLARAEQVVDLLRTRYIREGWKIDEAAAERALAYCRAHAADGSDPDEERMAAWDFFFSHGVSLDWVLRGDIAVLICTSAKNSARALRVADAELLALADEYLAADKKRLDLVLAVVKIEDDLLRERCSRPVPDVLRWRESDAELGLLLERPEQDVWTELSSIARMERPRWAVFSSVSSDDEQTQSVRHVTPSTAARARADEIIAVYEQWRSEIKPPRGYKRLVRERDKAYRLTKRLLKRVAETPARTVAGLSAKAKCGFGAGAAAERRDVETDMVGNPAGEMALSIFDDLAELEKTA